MPWIYWDYWLTKVSQGNKEGFTFFIDIFSHCSIGIENWPTRSSHSFLLTSWVVFSALLVLIYSSILINFLTIPAKSVVPTTWDELIKSTDYDIIMESESYIKGMFQVSPFAVESSARIIILYNLLNFTPDLD